MGLNLLVAQVFDTEGVEALISSSTLQMFIVL